jgi:hypothetical protein
VNISEPLQHHHGRQAKSADKLEPKDMGSGSGILSFSVTDVEPPV